MLKVHVFKTVNFKCIPQVNGEAVDLTGKTIEVVMTTPAKERIVLPFVLEDGFVKCSYKPLIAGNYNLSFYLNRFTSSETCSDVKVFRAVKTSSEEDFTDIDDYISVTFTFNSELNNYYTKTEIDGKIQSIESNGVDLTNYVTKDEVGSFVTLSDLQADYPTRTDVTNQIVDAISDGEVNLDGYAKTTDLAYYIKTADKKYAYAYHTHNQYITNTDADSKYAYKSDIPVLDSFATIAYVSYTGNNVQNWVKNEALKDYVKETDLEGSLSNYVTSTYLGNNYYSNSQVEKKISDYVAKYKDESDPLFKSSAAYTIKTSDITKWNGLNNYDDTALTGRISQLEAIDHTQYATKAYVLSKTSSVDLSDYYNKTTIDGKIQTINANVEDKLSASALNGYATENYVDNKVANAVVTETDPVFQASIAGKFVSAGGKIYKDDGATTSPFATEDYVESAVASGKYQAVYLTQSQYNTLKDAGLLDNSKLYIITDAASTAPDMSLYAKLAYIGENYYTSTQVDALIAAITNGDEIDLSAYAKKSYVQDYVEANAASRGYVLSQIANNNDTYYTKTEIDGKISTIESGDVDLSNYYTKTEADAKHTVINNKFSNYALISDIPDTTAFLTKTKADTLYATKAQVGSFVEQDTLTATLNDYYTKTASDTRYYTKAQVDAKIPDEQDMSLYAKKTDLNAYAKLTDLGSYYYTQTQTDAKINSYLGDYVTSSELTNTKTELEGKIALKADKTELNNYALKNNVYTKTEVDNKLDYLFWVGTQAEYNALTNKTQYKIYAIKQND